MRMTGQVLPKFEEAAAHFRQQKENANGNDHDGPHEAADAAALAGTTNTIAHLCVNLPKEPPNGWRFDAVAKHQNADPDQNERPRTARCGTTETIRNC